MNKSHLAYLASPAWAEALRTDLLPWLRATADLGDDVLEVGPGPGLTTDLLLELAGTVTTVEVDRGLADDLSARLRGRARVVHGDALTVALEHGRFTAATCFSMLHHMDSPQAQDRLFARLHDLLRPGAALLGVDSIDSETIRRGHIDDTYVPVDPATLEQRLRAAGFADAQVTRHNEHHFRFSATARSTPEGRGSGAAPE
jgi:SAM-dependent methyltransferase